MKCRGVFSKDADKEIELDLPDNATISDVRDAIAKMNGCNRKRVDLSLNNVVLEDSQPARCLIESGDVPFRYDYSIPRRIFMFDYNNRHVRLDLDVDSSFKEIASMLEKKIASLRSIDFSLYYNGQPLDLTTKTLDDYNIPPSGLILVVESMMELTVGLPTGNDKVYTILKSKRVVDLKERISASLFIAAQNLVVTNNGTTLADDVPLESLSSSEASSLLCAIQIPVTIIPDTKCAVFWDISSNLNATAQFLVDSLVADGRLALAKTENAMVYNRGEAILPTERLLSLLKSKETSLSVGKSNIYANLRLIIQHNKSRRILEIHGDLSIKEFKQKCLASSLYHTDP
ncbi:hypothetical protein BLSTO_02556 [Blastocystis sp. subtype 1]